MTKRTVLASAALATALTAGLGSLAASHDEGHGRAKRRMKAELRSFNEVPAVSSVAGGSFRAVLSADETSIEYRLRFWGLEGAVAQGHIHFGDHHTNGGISVWLCGTATNPGPTGTPLCADPAIDPTSGDVTGTLTATSVVGPGGVPPAAAGQGIAPGEFSELLRAIRDGVTYVNVHSTKFPGGEIRGEIETH